MLLKRYNSIHPSNNSKKFEERLKNNHHRGWALLRKLYTLLPGIPRITLFVDDTENSYRCLENNNPRLARCYLQHPGVTESYLGEIFSGKLVALRYGVEAQLRRFGLPSHCPVVSLCTLNAQGKNAADINMAIDLTQIGMNVREVIIGSSDSDMEPISRYLESKGIKVTLLPFGEISRAMQERTRHILSPEPLIERLWQHVAPFEPGNEQKVASLVSPVKRAMGNTLNAAIRSNGGTLSLARVGVILREQFSAHTYNWYNHHSCKGLALAVAGRGVTLSEDGHHLVLAAWQTKPTKVVEATVDPEYLKHRLRELMKLKAGKLSYAFAGSVLRSEFNAHNRDWFGYGSCNKLVSELLREESQQSSCGCFLLEQPSLPDKRESEGYSFDVCSVSPLDVEGDCTEVVQSEVDLPDETTNAPAHCRHNIIPTSPLARVGVPELSEVQYQCLFQELAQLCADGRPSVKQAVSYLKQRLCDEDSSVPAPYIKFVVDRTLRRLNIRHDRKRPSPRDLASEYLVSVLESCKRSRVRLRAEERASLRALLAC